MVFKSILRHLILGLHCCISARRRNTVIRDLVIANSRPLEYDFCLLKVDTYIWSSESLSILRYLLLAFAGLFECSFPPPLPPPNSFFCLLGCTVLWEALCYPELLSKSGRYDTGSIGDPLTVTRNRYKPGKKTSNGSRILHEDSRVKPKISTDPSGTSDT